MITKENTMDDILLDDVLYHTGVKGMKWGVRKQRLNKTNNRRSGNHAASGALIARSGGKKHIAMLMLLGRNILEGVAITTGTIVLNNVVRSPKAKQGIDIVGGIMRDVSGIKWIMDTYGVVKYDKNNLKKDLDNG